jgi:membrane-associated phospholipid phosphatase
LKHVRVAVFALAGFAAIALDVTHDGAFTRLDARVANWNAAHMPTAAEWAARPFSWVGGVIGTTLIVALAAILLLRAARRWEAAILVAATLVAQAATHGPKYAFARERPQAGSAVPLPDSYSFPSGHALTAVVVLGLLAAAAPLRYRLAASVAAATLALAIGASRIVLNVHWVSDVSAGFLLGLAVLALALLARSRWRSERPGQSQPRQQRRSAPPKNGR